MTNLLLLEAAFTSVALVLLYMNGEKACSSATFPVSLHEQLARTSMLKLEMTAYLQGRQSYQHIKETLTFNQHVIDTTYLPSNFYSLNQI